MSLKESLMTSSEDRPSGHLSGSPLLDHLVLKELTEDVGPKAATAFAREFSAMWPRRRDALASALVHADPEAAMDAILSLRVSSAMVGARRLEELAAHLETSLRTRGLAGTAHLMDEVEHCGEETVHVLISGSAPGGLLW